MDFCCGSGHPNWGSKILVIYNLSHSKDHSFMVDWGQWLRKEADENTE